jgi:multidrug resistance efflux pump
MSRKRIALYVAICIVPLVAALWIAGVDPANYVFGNYVTTNTAYVSGDLIQVSAPSPGSVTRILANVGDPVQAGQTIAYLSTQPQASNDRPVFPPIRAPRGGTIVHLAVLVGQSVQSGQSIATIANLDRLWVVAPVDENSFAPIHPGQAAEVYIPALSQTFTGHVSQLFPDQSLASRLGTAPTAGNTNTGTRPSGEMPVRIDFDYGDGLVYPGMTADVTIYVHS